jgi:mRNA-degrading endonuclease RelE of RelBE toxin-antitoxin system
VTGPYELGTAPPARRALADRLPHEVAAAAAAVITGPLLRNPRRVGKPLREELAGIYSARLGLDWRVLYQIDNVRRVVTVLDVQHRSAAARRRTLPLLTPDRCSGPEQPETAASREQTGRR